MGSVVWREGEGILVNLGCAEILCFFMGGTVRESFAVK